MGASPTKPSIFKITSLTIQDSGYHELLLMNNPVAKEYVIEHYYKTSKKFGLVCLETRVSESLDFILTQDLIDFEYFLPTDTFFPVYWQPVGEELRLSDFLPIRVIGKGGFSTVVLARKIDTGGMCAIKCLQINQQQMDFRQKLCGEIEIMKNLCHPFVVEFLGVIDRLEMVGIVMNFCAGGELLTYIRKFNFFPEYWAKFFFCEILEALDYLHKKKIIYRDMKPENILIDHEGHIKLVDFGLSKQLLSKHQVTFSFCGSPNYLSPEMKNGESCGMSLDFYGLGVILYEMLLGHTPDPLESPVHGSSHLLKFPDHLTKSAKDLLKCLLQNDPENRIGHFKGAEEIKSHKWLKGVNWKRVLEKQYKSPIEPISRESNFPEELLKEDAFQLLYGITKEENERNINENAKFSITSTTGSKKHENKEISQIEDSVLYTNSIDNSLMINQIPVFLSKFLF